MPANSGWDLVQRLKGLIPLILEHDAVSIPYVKLQCLLFS